VIELLAERYAVEDLDEIPDAIPGYACGELSRHAWH
jgi:hypothetical protein